MLRHWVAADWEDYYAIIGDDDTMRFIGGKGCTREDGYRRWLASIASWQVAGFGGWAVTKKDDGWILGMAALFHAYRPIEGGFEPDPEIGYIFAHHARGAGYAAEACTAILEWCDAELGKPVWAIIDGENAPSIRLARKLGFECLGEKDYNGEPIEVWKRPAAR